MSPELGLTEIIDPNEASIRPLLRRLFEHLGAAATDNIVAVLDLEPAQP
ncbi:MAG TPA: hypothetical protein VID04_03145 [Methylomirabilota bacterium]|jgi:hypothetical protein